MGSHVVKIEPALGDPARMFGRMLQIHSAENPPFEKDNRLGEHTDEILADWQTAAP